MVPCLKKHTHINMRGYHEKVLEEHVLKKKIVKGSIRDIQSIKIAANHSLLFKDMKE